MAGRLRSTARWSGDIRFDATSVLAPIERRYSVAAWLPRSALRINPMRRKLSVSWLCSRARFIVFARASGSLVSAARSRRGSSLSWPSLVMLEREGGILINGGGVDGGVSDGGDISVGGNVGIVYKE